ncbi:Elongator complex protein 5 [Amylocarpus encephaloides]|uniref:Elongator complex protein 5 n=1 Tax=Amylocarpus encephaloides TaxID=45428 RepID=A0A9P8C1H7_9HELO|nr:Elongator complex protein 5 [Amylocarpus encephaloides]
MAPSALKQRKNHNTLLFQKLLNLRDGASPFTLVLDDLEQQSGSVVKEFVRRAKISKTKIVFISFETLRKKLSFEPEAFVKARSKPLAALRTEILSQLPPTPPPASNALPTKSLLVLDSLTSLCTLHSAHLANFLSSLLISPQISLLATFHLDVPLPMDQNSYTPKALITLTYLSTSILSVSPLSHILAKKRARDRSLVEPDFALASQPEGALVGLSLCSSLSSGHAKGNANTDHGENGAVVIHAELRRRSGRGIIEEFVLIPSPGNSATQCSAPVVILLEEHPLYATPDLSNQGAAIEDEDNAETTFNLGLTEKQKRDRDGVVLPYFDAQKDGGGSGAGEGGRILYDMGDEDREDFDDEEDEI